MAQKPKDDIRTRGARILKAVVEEYLREREPVGSRTVAKKLDGALSSATIRNAMADLEEDGFLDQPHASAGRLPTAQGLRLYIDEMMGEEPLNAEEQQEIAQAFETASTGELHSVLVLASQILSSRSKNVSVAVAPTTVELTYEKIEFVRLSPHRLLTLFVSSCGLITQKIVHIEEDFPQGELNLVGRYLSDEFAGMTLGAIEEKVRDMIFQHQQLYYELARKAVVLVSRIFPVETGPEGVFVEGTSRLVENLELSDVRLLKETLETFEDRARLVKLLKGFLDSRGVTVALGGELSDPHLESLSVISSPYHLQGNSLGVLSVLGPTPLPYPRVVSLIRFIARRVDEVIERSVGLTPPRKG
jgi:heat-inducible transcriptional repressor